MIMLPPCLWGPPELPVLAAGDPAGDAPLLAVALDPLPPVDDVELELELELDDEELELLDPPQAASTNEMALAERPSAAPRRITCRRLIRPAMASR